MNVTIVTPFRDNGNRVDSYMLRIRAMLRLSALDHPAVNLRMVWVEGDSADDTLIRLQDWQLAWDVVPDERKIQIVQCDTGKPKYGSVVNAERFEVLATVFNAGLAAVDLDWSDYVLFIPSDIEYTPDLLQRLLAHHKDIIAPFVYSNNVFYDIWAFSRGGRNFGQFSPDQAQSMFGAKPIEMDTVGGVMLMRYEVIQRGAYYTKTDVDRGLCSMARALGFTVWADPATEVVHP